MTLRRRLFNVEGRQVHAWCGGHGPLVVLIHGSPGNAALVLPLARTLARRYSVIAPDTPGFGMSAALPGECLSVADIAASYSALLAALGVRKALVFGTHTGAAIGLELAQRDPGRVGGFVLEGVPIFTPAEQEPLLSPAYMPPIEIDELGGHYSRLWTRFHDQFIWFPWFRREPSNLLDAESGSAEAIHLWVEMYFQCAETYRPAYRAAISYGGRAVAAARAVTVPGVYATHASDMLYPHLDRLPTLNRGQRIERMDCAMRDCLARLELLVDEVAGMASLPKFEFTAAQSSSRYFFETNDRQIMVRRYGADGPPLLLLHDAPGAGQRLEPLAESLGRAATVLLPDLPGCGESEPVEHDRRTDLCCYADALAALVAYHGQGPVAIRANGFGAALARAFQARHPHLTAGLTLDGEPPTELRQRARLRDQLAPPIEIADDGHHWYRTWRMLRRSLIYRPWFETSPLALRRLPEMADARTLHDWTCEVMRSHRSYADLIDAVLAD